jgi:hypothetical protein
VHRDILFDDSSLSDDQLVYSMLVLLLLQLLLLLLHMLHDGVVAHAAVDNDFVPHTCACWY